MSTPPLKPLGLMQMLAPLLAVLLAVVLALLAAWALSLPAPAQSAKPAAEDPASYAGADRMTTRFARQGMAPCAPICRWPTTR